METNKIGEKGLKAFETSLEINNTLTTLDIDYTKFASLQRINLKLSHNNLIIKELNDFININLEKLRYDSKLFNLKSLQYAPRFSKKYVFEETISDSKDTYKVNKIFSV